MAGPNIELDIRGFDAALFELANAGKMTKRSVVTALKAAAYYLRAEMKKAVTSNRFGWEPLARYTRDAASFEKPRSTSRRWAKGAKMYGAGRAGRAGRSNRLGDVLYNFPPAAPGTVWRSKYRNRRDAQQRGFVFLAKLQNVFRYKVYDDQADPAAAVGILRAFTSSKAVEIFQKFQEGGSPKFDSANERMSNYWAALGFPLSRKTKFSQPARPLFAKLRSAESGAVDKIMKDTFESKFSKLAKGIK